MEAPARYTTIAPDLILLTGFEGEKLDDLEIPLHRCAEALTDQHLSAIPDCFQALHHLAPVLHALTERRSVGSVLANRIYPPTTAQELEALTHD